MSRILFPITAALLMSAACLLPQSVLAATPAAATSASAKVAPAKAGPAAVRCHDASGKFTKCTTTVNAKPRQCRDGKGKFIKCAA